MIDLVAENPYLLQRRYGEYRMAVTKRFRYKVTTESTTSRFAWLLCSIQANIRRRGNGAKGKSPFR